MSRNDEADELYELFRAFDDVRASDELISSTLAALANAQERPGAEDEAPNTPPWQGGERETDAPSNADEREHGAKAPIAMTKSSGSDRGCRKKARWRTMRIAALAACLALALTGGIAYATPVEHVEVAQDDSTLTLGINCFGITVSSSGSDETGRKVAESAPLINVARDEAIRNAVQRFEQERPDIPVEVDGEPHGDAPQQQSEVTRHPGDAPDTQPDTAPLNAREADAGNEPSPAPSPAAGQGDAVGRDADAEEADRTEQGSDPQSESARGSFDGGTEPASGPAESDTGFGPQETPAGAFREDVASEGRARGEREPSDPPAEGHAPQESGSSSAPGPGETQSGPGGPGDA